MKLPLGMFVLAGAACGSKPPPPNPPPDQAMCDLVACALDAHRDACCPREQPSVGAFGDRLAPVATAANRCATPTHYSGMFPVAVTFDASGAVIAVQKPAALESPLDPTILACLAELIRGVRFATSSTGATLTYVFELDPGGNAR